MARNPKCKVCGEDIVNKEKSIKKNNKYYHLSCYNKLQKEKELHKTDRQKLLDYINKLYQREIPKYVFIQIEEFKKNYDMTYIGMLLTLEYAFNEKEMLFDSEKGIGIIPYFYSEAKNNWLRQQEINKAIEEFEFEDKIETIHRNTKENSYLKKMRDRFNAEDI